MFHYLSAKNCFRVLAMNKLTAFIFDFDGTLAELHIDFNLLKSKLTSLAAAFLDEDIEPDTKPILEWVEGIRKRIQTLIGLKTAIEFQTRCRLLITATEMDAAKKGKLFPFAKSVLDFLKKRKIQTGIITRNCSAAVKLVFPDLSEYCQFFLAREDVLKVKPNPEHLMQVVRLMQIEPQNCLMIGDHPIDIQTAKSAGILSGAVASGSVAIQDLKKQDPDFIASNANILLHELIEKKLI